MKFYLLIGLAAGLLTIFFDDLLAQTNNTGIATYNQSGGNNAVNSFTAVPFAKTLTVTTPTATSAPTPGWSISATDQTPRTIAQLSSDGKVLTVYNAKCQQVGRNALCTFEEPVK